MARTNEEQLHHHRRIMSNFTDVNSVVRDAYRHVVPALDERRAKFEREKAFRQRTLDVRYNRIGSSRSEAVPFRELGADDASFERERKDATKKKMQSAVSKLKGGKVPGAVGRKDATTGVLGMLKQANAPPPKQLSDVRSKDLLGRTRKKEALFHDGKAAAALARVQDQREDEAARREAARLRDEMTAREKAAEERRMKEEEEEAGRPGARSRAVLRKMRNAGAAVMMGSRVATAIEDKSAEAVAAREAERLAVIAVASVADAAATLEALTQEAEDAAARLEAIREKLSEADVAAAAAGGFATRAEEIVAELRAGGQEDAAECAQQTVLAWRARADTIAAEADALRGECDALEEMVEVTEGQAAAAAARLEEETREQMRLRREAAEKEVAADEARSIRARSLTTVTKEMLTHFRAVEGSKGSGVEAAAAAAASAGVKADPAESFAADLNRATEVAAEVVAASLTAETDAQRAEAAEKGARSGLAAAHATADEAQEQLRVALGEVYAAAGSAVLGCEATLTLDTRQRPGRCLAAVQGPPTMSPAFASGATLKRLKPGFNLLYAVKGEGETAERKPADGRSAATLASKNSVGTAAAPKKMSLGSLVNSVTATKKAADVFRSRKSSPDEEAPATHGGLPRSLAEIFPLLVPKAARDGEYNLMQMSAERAAAGAAVAAFKRKPKSGQHKSGEGVKSTQTSPSLPSRLTESDGSPLGSEGDISVATGGSARHGSRRAAEEMMALVKDTAAKAAAARRKGLVGAAVGGDKGDPGGVPAFQSVFKPPKATVSLADTAKLKAVAAKATKMLRLKRGISEAMKNVEGEGEGGSSQIEDGDGKDRVSSASVDAASEKGSRASYANAEDVRKRLRIAIEHYNRMQQSAARAEDSVRKALDALVTAHGFASLKRREAVAFAAAGKLSEVRKMTVERICRAGIKIVADAGPRLAKMHADDPRQATIATIQTNAAAYEAATFEAETVVCERRIELERATAAVADAEQKAAVARDTIAEVEAALRIAQDEEAVAKQIMADAESAMASAEATVNRAMMEGADMGACEVAVAEAEVAREVLTVARGDEMVAAEAAAAAAAKVEVARRDLDEHAITIAAARDTREEAVRVLLVVEEEQERARQRQSAAATAMEVAAESERLAAVARDAAEEAAVSGASKTLIKVRALAAAVSASKTVAAQAQEVAAAAAAAASAASANVIAMNADVDSRHAELDARKIALARAEEALARAQDAERHDAAVKRRVDAEARKRKQVETLSAKWLSKVKQKLHMVTSNAESEPMLGSIRPEAEAAEEAKMTNATDHTQSAISNSWSLHRWAQGAKDAEALVIRLKWQLRLSGMELEDLHADTELAATFHFQLLRVVHGALATRDESGLSSTEAVIAALKPGSVIVELVAHSVVKPTREVDGNGNINLEDLVALVKAVMTPEKLAENSGDNDVLSRDQFAAATCTLQALDARVVLRTLTEESLTAAGVASVFETLPEVDARLMEDLSGALERLGLVATDTVARRSGLNRRDRAHNDDDDNAVSLPAPAQPVKVEEVQENEAAAEAWSSPTFAPPSRLPKADGPMMSAEFPHSSALASASPSSLPLSPAAASNNKKFPGLTKFRGAGRLVKAAVSFITPTQRAAAEVARLRREIVQAEQTLDAAEEAAAEARRNAEMLDLRSNDARLAATALEEKARAVRQQSDEAAVDVQAVHAAATEGGATPLAEAIVKEKREEMAVSRAQEAVAAAARTAAVVHVEMEETLVAVAEEEAAVEAARTELRRRKGNGELRAAEARLEEARTTAAELRTQGPGLEAAIAAADEAAASALELCAEVRRGYDEYQGRLTRARGALRAARDVADAAAARHAAERKKQTDAAQVLLAARTRLRKAADLRTKLRAEEDAAESRLCRAAELKKRFNDRKKEERVRGNSSGVMGKAERELRSSNLTAGEIEAIEVAFEEVDANALERMRAKHRRARGTMLRRHAGEMVALADWHRKRGGVAPTRRPRHKPGKYVDQLMEGYRVNVFRGGGDGLKPHEAEVQFPFDMPDAPYPIVPPPPDSLDLLRRQRQVARGVVLPEMDPGKTVRVARLEMEQRHAKELARLEGRHKEADQRMVATRPSRGAKFLREALADARARKKEAKAAAAHPTGGDTSSSPAGAGLGAVEHEERSERDVALDFEGGELPDDFFDDDEFGYDDAAVAVGVGTSPAAVKEAWGEVGDVDGR